MEHLTIKLDFDFFAYDELPEDVKVLVDKAKEATGNSYSPYSKFRVGAALRLEDGTMVKGANQENAAFSVTMIAAHNQLSFCATKLPIYPCNRVAIVRRTRAAVVTSRVYSSIPVLPIATSGFCNREWLFFFSRAEK